MEIPAQEAALLAEGVVARGWRGTKAVTHSTSFWIIEVTASAALGAVISKSWPTESEWLNQAVVTLICVLAGLGAVLLACIVAAPIWQRNEARGMVAEHRRASEPARKIVDHILKAKPVRCGGWEWEVPLAVVVCRMASQIEQGGISAGDAAAQVRNISKLPHGEDPGFHNSEQAGWRVINALASARLLEAIPAKLGDKTTITIAGPEALRILCDLTQSEP